MKHHLTTRPRHILVALALLAVTTLSGCSSIVDGGQPGNKDEATAEDTTPSQPASPLALNADGVLGGNATVTDFDAGEPGVVSVVSIGQFDADSSTLPFVFRNNTLEAISHVDATATVRDADGGLASNGTSQGTVPAQIPPGGLGLSYIFIEQGGVPNEAKFEFKFDTSPADTSPYNTGDLRVTELTATDDGIIGTAINQTGATLTGPYSVNVFCFDGSGALLSSGVTFANEDGDVAAEETVSFSDTFYDPCPTYYVGVTGYFS